MASVPRSAPHRADVSKPAALTDWAYEIIKDEILKLRIEPGRQLRVEELAERLGISRTPIREALLKLERDGLLQVIPRVGYFVTAMSGDDLRDLFEVRELLEARAVKQATGHLTARDLGCLEQLLDESARAVAEENLSRYLEIDIEFHDLLLQRAENRRLITIMESVRDLTFRERVFSLRSPKNVQATLREHRAILDALRNKDAEAAGRLMERHLIGASERLRAAYGLSAQNQQSPKLGLKGARR